MHVRGKAMLESDNSASAVQSAVSEAKREVTLQSENQEDDTGK